VRTLLVAVLVLGAAACEKASHENIDRWRYSEKGPGKLVAAVADASLDADLRAHAAQALVEIDAPAGAMKALSETPPEVREPVVEKLIVRLWGDAKVGNDMQIPTDGQVQAKDALFEVRALSTPAQVQKIDGYLIDWLSPIYEERARLGRHHGEKIIQAIGARAAPKLIAAAKLIVDRPEQAGKLVLVQDLSLRGIAGTGAPEAVGYLLDLAEKRNYPEPTLPVRAMRALGAAYLDTQTPAASAGLEAHVARLAKLADDERQDGETANLAFELLGASGSVRCLSPLLTLVRHRDVVRSWQATRLALRCGGAQAIVPVVEALPESRSYERGILEKYLWQLIIPLGDGAADAARKLIGSTSWVARVTGVELLGKLGGKSDAAQVRALAKDDTRLRGWWPKGDSRRDPTLGDVAQNVAEALEKKQ
jgi:hypothetical protein